MSLLRTFLPTKFLSRITFIGFSLLLALTVLVLWNSTKTRKVVQPQARLGGSSNLVIPNSVSIIEAKDQDADIPDMYRDFEQNPKAFVNNWKDAGGPVTDSGNRLKIPVVVRPGKPKKGGKGTPRINCIINNGTKYTCLRSKEGEVYMPFKFIKRYFEVYGDFSNSSVKRGKKKKNKGTFYFRHSNTRVYPQVSNYTASGEFLYFKEYNVEGRSKVMLISGEHGVPVSNQWDKAGYIYPIQVAQFGLSHFSKLVEDVEHLKERRTVLEDGTEGSSLWVVPAKSKLIYKKDNKTGNSIVYFKSSELDEKFPSLTINDKRVDFCLSFDVKFVSPLGNVSVVLESKHGYYVLTYHTEKLYKKSGSESMIYGIGPCKDWCTLHRDLTVDIKKFLPPNDHGWKQIRDSLKSIHTIEVRGEGYIDNIALSEKCHKGHFKSASDWIAQNQDSNGGWPVAVERVITTQKLTLDPGWYSAMAQGQAISLLVRAYITYKKPEYLTAAVKGLRVYQNLSKEHGVKAIFLDKYTWYEEYPTTPPLFVLNGFIYSLFGLYDLAQIAEGDAKILAKKLYDDGMRSLKAMLNIFDSGTGTFYDLRHVTISGMAPNRARWDYHAVHIGQLYYLSTIDSDPIFNSTMRRWMGYSNGKLAPHN